jgi:(E)-4-hydroxy-3-methylbut-2-enyl-diphosphate synthase
MGCVVNGPGESYVADVGVVGGGTSTAFYIDGVPVSKTGKNPEEILSKILEILEQKEKLRNKEATF